MHRVVPPTNVETVATIDMSAISWPGASQLLLFVRSHGDGKLVLKIFRHFFVLIGHSQWNGMSPTNKMYVSTSSDVPQASTPTNAEHRH